MNRKKLDEERMATLIFKAEVSELTVDLLYRNSCSSEKRDSPSPMISRAFNMCEAQIKGGTWPWWLRIQFSEWRKGQTSKAGMVYNVQVHCVSTRLKGSKRRNT